MIPSSSASLPIIVIFERHWDKVPKQTVKDLIPKLAEEGYDTFCIEAPEDLSQEEILLSHKTGLEFDSEIHSKAKIYLANVGIKDTKLSNMSFSKLAELMRLYMSSQRYLEVAEKIKGLPSSLLLKEIFTSLNNHSINVKGIDINQNDFDKITSLDLSQRIGEIENKEEERIKIISNNLIQLKEDNRGIIFSCGALHAENLMNKFKEKGLEDRVLYYFPHSNKNYDDGIDDVKECLLNKTLENHTFCLINEIDKKILTKRIIREVKLKNTEYTKEIFNNSHCLFLNNFFKENFRSFMRPGYYVDALLDIEQLNAKKITEKLNEFTIATHTISFHKNTYLVVENINTKGIADNIRKLK